MKSRRTPNLRSVKHETFSSHVGSLQIQNSQIMNNYIDAQDYLLDLMFEPHASVQIGQPCSCQQGNCIIVCKDCIDSATTCMSCFLKNHGNNSTHWAQVWQPQGQFFICHNISSLNDGFAIQLGHHGSACPNRCNPQSFILVNVNGIHETQLSYCECHQSLQSNVKLHIDQLMCSRIFPG